MTIDDNPIEHKKQRLFTRHELLSGIILAIIGSAVWEWLIKFPLEKISPSFTSAFVDISHIERSIVYNSATYSEQLTALLLITTVLSFLFRLLTKVIIKIIDDSNLRVKTINIADWATQIFFAIIMIVNGYAQLKIHGHITWFRQSLDIIAPYVGPEKLTLLRSEWARMATEHDLEKVENDVKALAKGTEVDGHLPEGH